ncbi:AAA family ATPase [Desulfobacterales bacterium HSG2]|nr:AAA family ATPase [Desulfobacterales bacterium HSG2]
MIKEIDLENFKAFKQLGSLNVKPVTILCGSNNCGKSSVLQSILLFRQTFESQNPSQTFLLNGRFTHLGSFENIIYNKDIENIVCFGFKIPLRLRGGL